MRAQESASGFGDTDGTAERHRSSVSGTLPRAGVGLERTLKVSEEAAALRGSVV